MKDKCEAKLNLSPPKSIKEVHQFCGMVNFLSSFLPKLRLLLVQYMNLQRRKIFLNGHKNTNKHLTLLKLYVQKHPSYICQIKQARLD